jgi:hypothetical protein
MYYAIVSLGPDQRPPAHPDFTSFTGCSSYYFDLLREGRILNYKVYAYHDREERYKLIGRIMNAERDILHGRLYTEQTMFETIDQLMTVSIEQLRESAQTLEKQLEPAGERAPEMP